MSSKLRMIVAGGGTGGHFFPAQSIYKSLAEKGVVIKYMGSKYGIEAGYKKNNEIDMVLLNIRGIQRQFTLDGLLKNFLFPFRFFQSYYKSIKIIKDFKPHLVIGTGGYSSGLPLIAAIQRGIKTVIQEQNSYPGITTRKLASKVDIICVAFNESINILNTSNVALTGNPIRNDLCLLNKKIAKSSYGFNVDKPVIGILGGSQGSTPFNNHFKKTINDYKQKNIQLLWQTGKNDFDHLKSYDDKKNIRTISFINNMNQFYSAADIIISRSGAIALSEMTFLGKAMILIPLPHSAGNHQYTNAKSIEKNGSAIIIQQSQLKLEYLEESIFNLLKDPIKINQMEKKSKEISFKNSTEKIINIIMEMAQ